MNKLVHLLFTVFVLFVSNVSAEEYEARLVWPDKQLLAFPVTGIVESVMVQSGQLIRQGDKIAQLDPVPFQLELKRAQAKLDRIGPLLFDAQRDFDQAQELFERTVLSEVELQKIESVLKGLKADNNEAKATLELANWRYSRSRLTAPFAGRIIDVFMHAGDIVSDENMSRVMISMVPNNLIWATFSLAADSMGKHRIGEDANVEVASGRYPAIVKSIKSEDSLHYQVSVEFSFPADHFYVAGQKAKVMF